MENRERDRVSQRDSSTDAGELNRKTSADQGRQKSGTGGAEFGQNIGRSENLSEDQGGMMRNKEQSNLGDNMENESSRRSGSGSFDSQTGRSGSSSDVNRSSGSSSSNITRDDSESTSRSGNSKPSDSNREGRH